ncbi:MAG: fumarylacetoacetate hydrolase family protein [Limisphaerales bacterium]|jgi:2-keto-4-pentenoate hydratase/2-oxohepta-3-ene-1,7-dioic acid hydratase in catechol pathway
MRLCRFEQGGQPAVGFFLDDQIIPLSAAAEAAGETLEATDDLLAFLPHGSQYEAAQRVAEWLAKNESALVGISDKDTSILTPIPKPNKLLLLAGNYAKHIEEGGDIAVERAQTFPYVFMKPPSTTLNRHGGDIPIPAVSPDNIDWECELGVVIGKEAKGVTEAEALDYVAGYTVVNDISDRGFRPNPNRKERDRDKFFDWQHGKWHDGSCPVGPCIACPESIPDPQVLPLKLTVNGEVHQDASTALQIFPVAGVIAFVSAFITLEPGDIISTGTAAGVGHAKGVHLNPGDIVEAGIDGIGVLKNTMVLE